MVQGGELRDFVICVQFFVNPEAKVEQTASSIETDVSGHVQATVTYPSILEIWPEMDGITSIKIIEVRP